MSRVNFIEIGDFPRFGMKLWFHEGRTQPRVWQSIVLGCKGSSKTNKVLGAVCAQVSLRNSVIAFSASKLG